MSEFLKDITIANKEYDVFSNENIPRTENELIYYKDNNKEDKYSGLFTQQLMYEDGIVVDNQTDYTTCAVLPSIHPDIKDTFQQFSESPYCPEYGNGLSCNQYSHISPKWGNTGGYGYNSWTTAQSGNVVSTNINSDEFNGYIYPHKVRKIVAETLLGAYKNNTSGDIETITLLNSNHATPRSVSTTDGRTFYRNSMFDLEGSPEKPDYCAWVYKPSNIDGAYIIYSPSVAITQTEVDNGIYWSITKDNAQKPKDARLYKIKAEEGPTDNNTERNPVFNPLTDYYKDSFPIIGNTYNVYYASAIDTLEHRRSTISSGTVVISENIEASGYLGALHILITNASSIDNIFSYYNGGSAPSICGTMMVYTEILPITGIENASKECTDNKTLFSFVRTHEVNAWDGCDAYAIFPFKHQRRYFITVNKGDCWLLQNSNYTQPENLVSSFTSGEKLLEFNQDYDMDKSQGDNVNKAKAILSEFTLDNGIIKLKLSKVGASSSNGTLNTFENINNFYEAGTEGTTQNALVYTNAELVIDFRNHKYSIIAHDGTVVANNMDLSSYEDNLIEGNSDSIERAGDTKYNVTVVENGVETEVDICSLFTEEVQFMYSSTSLEYHALNCKFLQFNNRDILRADDNTVWRLNETRDAYVRDSNYTALNLMKGSRLSFNDITKKLWYSNGTRIYQIGGSFS